MINLEKKQGLPKFSYISIKVHFKQMCQAKHLNTKLALEWNLHSGKQPTIFEQTSTSSRNYSEQYLQLLWKFRTAQKILKVATKPTELGQTNENPTIHFYRKTISLSDLSMHRS